MSKENLLIIPSYRNATDLLTWAMSLTTKQRTERREAVQAAARRLRSELEKQHARWTAMPPGQAKDRMRKGIDAKASELKPMDDWVVALERAQRLNYLDN